MSHRPETTKKFFQAHKDMTVTSKEQPRQNQLDPLESMKVFEEVYEDELPAGTHVMSGRWVDTMKTPTVWSKYTARGYEEHHNDESCFAATTTIQDIRIILARCLDKRDQGHEAFVTDYTQAFLILKDQCVGVWRLTNLKTSLIVLCVGHRKVTRLESRVIM